MSSPHSLSTENQLTPTYDKGDIAFVLLSGFLVLLMVPGLALLYSGLVRRKNALHIMFCCILANAVVVIVWYVWGFSLGFSPTATNGFIGNLANAGLLHVEDGPQAGSPLIPQLLYSFFQLEFACVTVAILVGAFAERGRIAPLILFSFLWTTLVYCPLTHWVWAPSGWALKWGVLDYAGGGPVELGSGIGGLAYALVLGRRKEAQLVNFRPHNVSMICMGTFFLWVGWLGFNSGSAYGANGRAIWSAWNSNLSAAAGGIVWCALDYSKNGKYTLVGFCSGTIAGLVAATPSSGFVPGWAAFVIGVLSGAACNYATAVKHYVAIDDALDMFAEHAVGGMVGLLGNALFASPSITAMDAFPSSPSSIISSSSFTGTSIPGGWIERNWRQMYVQLAYVLAVSAYTFGVTAGLAWGFDWVGTRWQSVWWLGWMKLRAEEDWEIIGMDDAELGEFVQDFVELRRDFNSWSAPGVENGKMHTIIESSQEESTASTMEIRQPRMVQRVSEVVPLSASQHLSARSQSRSATSALTRNSTEVLGGESGMEMYAVQHEGGRGSLTHMEGDHGERAERGRIVAAGDRHGVPDTHAPRLGLHLGSRSRSRSKSQVRGGMDV
ncbi:ammonium transporter [Clavulina sp. PMI_390]|nr:ammonium transporter [Clavulina sp. PMI_390]